MKKTLLVAALAFMAATDLRAQCEDLRNEVSLSYGVGSTSQFGDGLGEGLSKIFSDTEYDDGFVLGPISVEYFRHLNNTKLALGGLVSYSKWNSDILKKKGEHEKVGERKRNYFAVMPAIKWYWINKNSLGLYSKGAVGVALLNSKEKDILTNTSEHETSPYLMFQLSFIGLEFGKQFRGFVEAGIGEQGFLQAGLRYKF